MSVKSSRKFRCLKFVWFSFCREGSGVSFLLWHFALTVYSGVLDLSRKFSIFRYGLSILRRVYFILRYTWKVGRYVPFFFPFIEITFAGRRFTDKFLRH